MSKLVAYLTMEDSGDFVIYDQLTYSPLSELGWQVVEVPWSWPIDDWTQFDAVVIRSTWDYQNRPDEFLSLLGEIESSGVPLFNPRAVCQWNIDKGYLRDLAARGVPTIPTRWLERFDQTFLRSLFDQSEFAGTIVLKPTIGAGADNIFVLRPTEELGRTEKLGPTEETGWQDAAAVYAKRPLFVQPFLNSIVSLGEYSLFYFGGEYSHAILKTPAQGDFRVQEEHGGIIRSVQVDNEILAVGEQTISAIGQPLLYARVDLVRLDDDSLAVIELELIEPSLYFPYDEESPRRFARALDRMVSENLSENP